MRSALRWCLVISMVAVWGVVWADSIWDNAKGNLYTAERKRLRVGDVVTILISETSSAAQEATTKTTKRTPPTLWMDVKIIYDPTL